MASRRRKKDEDVAEVWGSAAADLERALTKVRRGERIVRLFQTGPGQGTGDSGAADLAKALVDCHGQPKGNGLVALRLRGHQVGDDGATHIANALEVAASEKMHTIDVSGNRISDFGMIQLSKALLMASKMRILDLSGNKFGDQATEELAKALPPNLEELDLTGNQIGPDGIKALASVVKHHPLKELSIGENHTGDTAATYIAEAFGEGCGLVALHFTWSDLTDHAASCFAQHLCNQPKLRELWLTNNKIQDAGALELCKATEEHGQLRMLALDKNKITDVASIEFVDALVRLNKKDMTCSLIGNISKRFNEDSLTNLNIAAATVRAMANRSMTLEMLLKFFKDFEKIGEIASQSSTTQDVVENVIKPQTDRRGACYAEFFHSFDPEYYVVHCWKALFSDLLLALATHASGFTQPKLDPSHEQYVRRPEALQRRYFVDAFCIDQVRTFPQKHPRCETDKFDFVLKQMSRQKTKLLVAMDRDHTPMARTWCLTEVCFAKLANVPVLISFGPIRPMPRRRKGMSFAKAGASLEIDMDLLREELMQRGPGTGEKFENDVVEPLEKQAIQTYKAIYETMPVEQKEDCDWVKAQDDAREDMKMYDERGIAEEMRVAVEAGIAAQVEDTFMEPMRRRLAQLELALVLNSEAIYSLLEHIDELRRTLRAAEEEKLDDPPLISRGRKRLAEQEAEARRLDAQKELLKSTKTGQKVVERWELDQKAKKRMHPEVPLLDIPVVKHPKEMSGQEKKEEELRVQRVKDQQALVKGLRLAFEEGDAAGCDREVIDNCKRVYSELRIFTAVRSTLHRLALEQAAQRIAEEAARKVAERRAAKEAAREARRQAALEKGEDFEESDDESDDGQSKFYTEEDEIEEEEEDPKDVEDGSADTLGVALMRAREISGRHEIRDFGKAFMKELHEEAYRQLLMRELIFSTAQRSAAELQHILQQVVQEGIGSAKVGQMPQDVAHEIGKEKEERPGVRRFLPDANGQDVVAPEPEAGVSKQELHDSGEQAPSKQSEQDAATSVSEAYTRLAFLEMIDAMEARDLDLLLKLVPAAKAASVQETEINLGWRLVCELELGEALKKQDLKEIRMRIEKAREAEVEEETIRDGARKLAQWEIREGIKVDDAKMLERAIEEGAAAGLTDKQLFMGKQAFLKLQVAVAATTDSMETIHKLLATAKEMGWPSDHKDLVVAQARLAFLELRAAIEGQDQELLHNCLEKAKEFKIDKEELLKGDYRFKVLELENAMKDFDRERLRDAMMDAKEVNAPKHMFIPAKRKLADMFPEAYTDWMELELQEAVSSLSSEAPSSELRCVLEEAMKANVDEDSLRPAEEKLTRLELVEAARMVDRFEIERILNNAEAYGWNLAEGTVGALYQAADAQRKELVLQERVTDCIESMNFAVISLDLDSIRHHVEESEELGLLDHEVTKKALEILKDYS